MTAAVSHKGYTSVISLKKFKKRDDGLYGILDVKDGALSERDLEELKLRSLAVALNKSDE